MPTMTLSTLMQHVALPHETKQDTCVRLLVYLHDHSTSHQHLFHVYAQLLQPLHTHEINALRTRYQVSLDYVTTQDAVSLRHDLALLVQAMTATLDGYEWAHPPKQVTSDYRTCIERVAAQLVNTQHEHNRLGTHPIQHDRLHSIVMDDVWLAYDRLDSHALDYIVDGDVIRKRIHRHITRSQKPCTFTLTQKEIERYLFQIIKQNTTDAFVTASQPRTHTYIHKTIHRILLANVRTDIDVPTQLQERYHAPTNMSIRRQYAFLQQHVPDLDALERSLLSDNVMVSKYPCD